MTDETASLEARKLNLSLGKGTGLARHEPPPVSHHGQLFRTLTRLPTDKPAAPLARLQQAAGRKLRRLPRAITLAVEEERAFGHGFLFVPVAVGGGAAFWFSLPRDPPFWPLVVVLIASSLAAIGVRNRGGVTTLSLTAVALFLAGMMLAEWEAWRRSTVLLDSPVTTFVTGVVERREVDASGRWRYIVKVSKTAEPTVGRPPEQVSLLARSKHPAFLPGDVINGRARLSPPSGPALPGLHDFAFTSYFDGIGAVGFFYGAPKKLEQAVPAEGGWSFDTRRFLFGLRGAIAERIRSAVSGDAGAFAAAIVTDERRAISAETVEALRLSGLAHIVAISGLNMALAAGIFFIGVRSMLSVFMGIAQRHAIKKIAAVGALAMATAYYLISGFGVSAQRAYIMMAVMLVAALLDRPAISMRNVAISALVIMALTPSEILGPSFRMSFAATAALVAGYALWKRRRQRKDAEHFLLRHPLVTPFLAGVTFLSGIFVTSLIGGLSTSIYSIEHFHRLATYGLAANLAAMPIISFVVMPAGLIGMLLMPFGLEWPFLTVMGYGLEAVIAVAKHVADWGGDVPLGRQHPWFLAVATAGLLLLVLLRTRLRLLGLPLLVLAVILSWQERAKPLPDLLISEDGTLVALISGQHVATNRARPPDFIFGQWTRALTLPEPSKPDVKSSLSPGGDNKPTQPSRERRALTEQEVEAARSAMRSAPEGGFSCVSKAWCAAKTDGSVTVAVVEDGRFVGAACDAADIVIAPSARFHECRSGTLMISGQTLRKTGALEINFNGARQRDLWTASAAMAGLSRSWNRHRHYDWRSKSFSAELPAPLRAMLSGSGE